MSQQSWNEWELLDGFSCLTEEHRARWLRRAEELGLNAWELAIFNAISYGFGQVNSKELLAQRAFGVFQSRNPIKAQTAIERCFQEGWLQFLTADFLDAVQRMLAEADVLVAGGQDGGLIGDHEGLSEVGLISFTQRGSSIYFDWLEFDPQSPDAGHWALIRKDTGVYDALGTSIEQCEYAIAMVGDVAWRDAPIAIGRWCDRWWRMFNKGFRIRFHVNEDTVQ